MAATRFTEVVELMLEHGADVNAQDKFGKTPLHEAVVYNYDTAKLLLEHGANVNAVGVSTHSPLVCAIHGDGAEFVDTRVVKLLLSYGAVVLLETSEDEDE